MSKENSFKPAVIIFDVYDTLLDMSEVERRVNHLMDSRSGFVLWFELLMQYCFVDNCTIQFNPFDSIARVTMQMAANHFNRSVEEDQMEDILDLLKHLPLHEGVADGLSALHDSGFRLAALTNSPARIVNDRMHRTGLVSYFEEVLSAEHVKKYKPSIEVYEWAARSLRVPCQDVLMVTSNGWDIAGAANAGMKTACLRNNKQLLYTLAPVPDLVCQTVEELTTMLA